MVDRIKRLDEYLMDMNLHLKRYFERSPEEIKKELPNEYHHLINDFLNDNRVGLAPIEDTYEFVLYEDKNLMLPIGRTVGSVINQFGEWLYGGFNRHGLGSLVADEELPTWTHMSYIEPVKNKWLVHFTNDARSVAKEGFTTGVSNIDKLGLTLHLDSFYKEMEGYNFAFDIDDFEQYYREGRYGTEAVIFRSSGVKVFHHGDTERQVIFWGPYVKDIIPIMEYNDEYYVESVKTGKDIVTRGNLPDIINWTIKNHNQYRKHLT